MKTNLRTMVRRGSVIAACLGLVSGALAWGVNQKALAPSKTASVRVAEDDTPLPRKQELGTSYAQVVKKVVPSVVKVQTVTRARQTSVPGFPGMEAPWFRRFFGEDDAGRDGFPQLRMPPQRGMGSGVVVSQDGYILTNNHVVDGADEVKVSLQDGREFTAKVVGKDPKSDVAVLKVEAKELPSIEMTDSDKTEVGDVVLAVGNPFGIGQTVTMGIISATGRATLGLDYEDFIQTDAPINPGNSGGALVDMEGRLVGINTAILSQTGGNAGIGFAIPTNLARTVMQSLVKDGKVTRGYLGVMVQDVTPALAKEFRLDEAKGALVGDVVPRSPADKAGVKNGDVVLEYDGKPVRDSRHLKLAAAATTPGRSVPIKVLREGATKNLAVAVQELPGSDEVAKADTRKSADEGTLNGVEVTDLDARVRRELRVPEKVQGALVTNVDPDSPAREAGLKPGDVILEINRRPVKDAAEAVQMTEQAKNKNTLLRVWSEGGTRYVVVDETKAG